jgi:hypothetical protein
MMGRIGGAMPRRHGLLNSNKLTVCFRNDLQGLPISASLFRSGIESTGFVVNYFK